MNTTNRRSFLKKSFFLPFLTFLATGFKTRGQAKGNDILYARRLDGDHGPDRTHIFYLTRGGEILSTATPSMSHPSGLPSITCGIKSRSNGTL